MNGDEKLFWGVVPTADADSLSRDGRFPDVERH